MSGGILLEGVSPCTSKPGHVVHDNLDDRREIFYLLGKLSPSERLAWLEWACRHATLGHSQVRPAVARKTRELAARARWDSAADSRLTLEIYFDLFMLDVSFRVDFEALLKRLEAAVRRRPQDASSCGRRAGRTFSAARGCIACSGSCGRRGSRRRRATGSARGA